MKYSIQSIKKENINIEINEIYVDGILRYNVLYFGVDFIPKD